MGAKNYKHISVESDLKEAFDKLKKDLSARGFHHPTNDEVMKMLMKKHEMFKIPSFELDKIFMNERGFDHETKVNF